MKSVWLARVSVGVIAAWMAGCGGGSGGDVPSNDVPQQQASPQSNLQKQKLLTIRKDEFKESRLVSNNRGDLLLVWDDRRAIGAINSMFYHPGSGWTEVKVVAPAKARSAIIDVVLDNQGSAVVATGGRDILGVPTPDFSFVYTEATNNWQVAQGDSTVFSVNALVFSPMLIADNSAEGIAYLVGRTTLPINANEKFSVVRVYRLLANGNWITLDPAPVLAAGESSFLCNIICVDSVKAAADGRGRLHVTFTAAYDQGKRTAFWSAATGWVGAFVLDSDKVANLPNMTYLSIHENGTGVAVWTGVSALPNQIVQKVAWFNGATWSNTESLPDGMTEIDFAHLNANGSTDVFGKNKIYLPVSIRRPTLSEAWSGLQLVPFIITRDVQKLIERNGDSFIPVRIPYRTKADEAPNFRASFRVRIDTFQYGANGWTEARTLTDQDDMNDVFFAVTGNQLMSVEWDSSILEAFGVSSSGDVNAFSFALP